MLIKLIKYFLIRFKFFLNTLIVLLFRVKLLPKHFHPRAKVELKLRKYQRDFDKLELSYDKLGFYYVVPMPSKDYLSSFYKETYWNNRLDKNFPVRKRDIEHYKLLLKTFPNFNEASKNILNFGSGHYGISVLLSLKNHNIVNFDYHTSDKIFEERWTNVNDLNKINESFDLIYSSHSLEHVQNIYETIEKLKKISHDKTIFFFEVPNCYQKEYQKIHMPHTYYFTKLFFKNCFKKIDVCKFYNGEEEVIEESKSNILRILTQDKILLDKKNT